MAEQRRDRRTRRPPLSREAVLVAAVLLADEDGIEALSMRRLGAALGVEAMSLYNHVADKDDLLGGMVELVVAEFELPSTGRPWKAALRASAISAHEALVRHPWAADLLVTRPMQVGPARLRHMDGVLRALRGAGLSEMTTDHAFHVLDSYIIGITLQEVSFPIEVVRMPGMAEAFLRDFPVDEYPAMAEHVRFHIDSGIYDEGDFEFGLDLILDGLERSRKRSAR